MGAHGRARKIVFIGNCQANCIHRLYRDQAAPIHGDDVHYVPSYVELNDQSRSALIDADLIVSQRFSSDQAINIDGLRQSAEIDPAASIIEFPMVTGRFLWPHACDMHVLNTPLHYFQDGPFSEEFGDKYLNKHLLKGDDLGELAKRYISMDISTDLDLDRLYQLYIDQMKAADEITGFSFASFIERNFRTHSLFRTASNLERPLYLHMAADIFHKIGVNKAAIERIANNCWSIPVAHVQTPIHPSVAHHFNLEYVSPKSAYLYFTGERMTFTDYTERYLKYEYNDPLFDAIYGSWSDNSKSGRRKKIAQIKSGIYASSMKSASAHHILAVMLLEDGDAAAAEKHSHTAVSLDPINIEYRAKLAECLYSRGSYEAAIRILYDGLQKWPGAALIWHVFANFLKSSGLANAARRAAMNARRAEPHNQAVLGDFPEIKGLPVFGKPVLEPFHAYYPTALAVMEPAQDSPHSGRAGMVLASQA